MQLFFMDLGKRFWQSVEVKRETKRFYFVGVHTWEIKVPKDTKPIIVARLGLVPVYRVFYTEAQKNELEQAGIK